MGTGPGVVYAYPLVLVGEGMRSGVKNLAQKFIDRNEIPLDEIWCRVRWPIEYICESITDLLV